MKDLANYGIETYAAKFDRTEQMISTAMYKEKIHMGTSTTLVPVYTAAPSSKMKV